MNRAGTCRGRAGGLFPLGFGFAAWLLLTPTLPAQEDWMSARLLGSREGAAMAYDAARHRIVLFGGRENQFLADTWEWDGVIWVQRSPLASPSPRRSHAMTYDAARQRVVLFGGSQGLADTWA